jgi:hypothetical protein
VFERKKGCEDMLYEEEERWRWGLPYKDIGRKGATRNVRPLSWKSQGSGAEGWQFGEKIFIM